MLRVAVLGAAGNAGRRHCAAFTAAGCEVLPIDIGMNDREISPMARADIVSIATPDDLHARAVVSALQQGKHVFCEKPLSHNSDGLRLIEDAAQYAETTFSCNLPLRHNREAENFLRGITAPAFIMAEYRWGRKSKMAGWRGQIPDYSIVCGGGIHLIDLLMHATGAFLKDITARYREESYLSAQFWLGEVILVHLLVDFRHDDGDHQVILHAKQKSMSIAEPADFAGPIKEFLRAIEANEPGNGREALTANRACLAIERAART